MRLFAIGACALALATAVSAQTRASFAGAWTGGVKMMNLVGVVGPQDMTITQDASVIRIDRAYGRNRVSVLVKLDGSESTNVLDPGPIRPGDPPSPRTLMSRATWEGSKLKIATEFLPKDAKQKVVTIEILSLDGGNLVVERSDEAVGAFSAPPRAGMIQERKDTYKRIAK